MTERKTLGLPPDQLQLRQQRTQALASLKSAARKARPANPDDRDAEGNVASRSDARPGPRAAKPAGTSRPTGASRPPRPIGDTAAKGRADVRAPVPPTGAVARSETVAQPAPRVPAASAAASGAVRVVKSAAAQAPGSSDGIRLNKRMAELGLCSRREGDDWIEKGWVTVNGEVAVMGQLVRVQDRIDIAPAARGHQRQQVTILLHKPMGYVSGQAEDGHEPAVTLINPRTHWSGDGSRTRFNFDQLKGLAPAGRLDIDSVGLLVLTQDGRVARQLIGEDSDTEKEYLVRVTYATVQGDVTTNVQAVFPPERLALLRHGLSLDGEALKPAQVDWQNPEQLRFILQQGKKRQIRRMCEQVGLKVVGLKRIRMGRVVLGNLPVGQWRYLGPNESF